MSGAECLPSLAARGIVGVGFTFAALEEQKRWQPN